MDAGDASFVPGDDTVWDAYWLLIGLGGVLGFFESHLIEDDWSPSGFCFDYDGYELRGDGSWEWASGDRYWDYSGADQLLSECSVSYHEALFLDEDECHAVLSFFRFPSDFNLL